MSGKDPELSRLGEVLSSARKAYAEAKKSTDAAKAVLNDAGSAIQQCNNTITQLKMEVDAAYDSMRARRAEGDRDGADSERTRAQGLQEELTAQYDSKKGYFAKLDEARALFNEALEKQKSLRETVQESWDAFNARLEFLKAENAKEQENWKEKPCRMCGSLIRYNIKWKHIPSLCRDCYEKDRMNWEDRTCARCGGNFRINKTWEHIPSICSSCRKEIKMEKAQKASGFSAVPQGEGIIAVAASEMDAV